MRQFELREAKQQSQDLNRAGEFINALLHRKPGEDLPKPPADIFPQPQMVNGVSPHRTDHILSFSQPPAPPPQLPLPEKPDAARHADSNLPNGIKENSPTKLSPTKGESSSSQMLSLIEALTSAKREIDSQGSRMRQLEEQLKQERRARENAEERARHLLDRSKPMPGVEQSNGYESDRDSDTASDITTIQDTPDSEFDHLTASQINGTESLKEPTNIGVSPSKLQERLDHMVHEMEEMKAQLDFHKHRAEAAEEERTGLAEMVERIRAGEPKNKAHEASLRKKRSSEMATQTDAGPLANGSATKKREGDGDGHHAEVGTIESSGAMQKSKEQARQLQNAISTALSMHHDDRLLQSAPYASILGVVLIGVGIMTYLNGWQKIER